MQQDLVEQGAIPQLIEMLHRFCFDECLEARNSSSKGIPSDEVDVDIQSDALHILSSICKTTIRR